MSSSVGYTDYLDPVTHLLYSLRRHSRSLSIAIVVLAVLMFGFLRLPLAQWQHRLLAVELPLPPPVDAVVVLGYAVDHDAAVVTAPLAARLEHAYQLLCRDRVADTVVLSGGCSWAKAAHLPSEAAVMQQWLTARWRGAALPQTADSPALAPSPCSRDPPVFVLEEESTSTYTNALYSLRLLAAQWPEVRRLLLVTSSFHQKRTAAVFQRLMRQRQTAGDEGWRCGVSTTPDDLTDRSVTQFDFWREIAAIVLYAIRGCI